jgi:hypothetical protein
MYYGYDIIPCSLTRDPNRDTSKPGVCPCFFDATKDFFIYVASKEEKETARAGGGWDHVVRVFVSFSIS